MENQVKKSIFELLCLNSLDEVKNRVFKDGKRKSYCPIRFLNEEQIDDIVKGEQDEK